MQLISPDKRTLRVSKLRETLYNEKMFHLSKEDAERMLEAIQQREQEIQEQLKKKKMKGQKIKVEKDW